MIGKTKRKNIGITAAIAGAVWGLNIVDATIAGIQMRKRVSLYFSSTDTMNEFSIGICVDFSYFLTSIFYQVLG